ncbi:PREDICTED: hemicentin-1-like isoform X2 [Nicrophorus vespilloides]|uniref:Hemicentin-1-like isoform X2 n=1 Tax=Nicrophorus vespilloides TaxID=110193 RepID=A0ABM1NB81_NICVS|nr:PREDICTED: hemicentin-1-like isoform X2 [Nicrophorus vespilloides]
MEDVQGVLAKKKGLPCDITPRDRDDAVAMVLWFKESIGEPLYSFDVRGRHFNQAKLWSSPTVFGTRAYFRAATNPATLVIDDIQLTDEGIYRCRVDFKDSPTRNSNVNFTVIIPPERPVIYDGRRRDRTTKLELYYNEGSDVNLICEVAGGRPRPRVTWFLENTIIDDSYETRSDGTVVNHLTFPNVGRQHLKSRLICQAMNSVLAPPATSLVVLDINLKPQSVSILTKEKQVSAEKRYEVECRTTGSRPEAVITWWKGSRPVKKLAKNFSEQNNQSLSILTFEPVIDDDGKYLTCRAENPSISDSALEDKWRLNVHYMPVVTLKMGSSLNPEDIKEGDDVYFECNIRANPKMYKLSWFHNGQEIHHNVSAGVILSDQSLVLQSVTRATAGDYTCMAANSEGRGTSNPVTLTVRYAPVCVQDREELYGALKQETVALRCQVDANPAIVTFHWTFNNSGDLTEVSTTRFTSEMSSSRLNYTPVSDMDYGTLSCWGQNEVGHQHVPCVFQVVAAGRPFPLLNCTVMNQTSDSLQVECSESFDGGLPQSFLMEILETPSLRSKINVTAARTPPNFYVDGLEAGASYKLMLYAINAKGRSDATIIDAVTFKGVAKYTGTSAGIPVSPLILVLLATVGILAAGVCLVLAALCRRHYTRPCHRDGGSKHVPMEAVIAAEDLIVDGHITGVRSPVIPDTSIIETLRNGPTSEGSDPDIIRNQYERRQTQSFMKVYEPPKQKIDENEDEVEDFEFRHVAKEKHIPSQTVYRSLQRQNRIPVSAVTGSQTLTHKYRGPEVVTTSNRIQESCI